MRSGKTNLLLFLCILSQRKLVLFLVIWPYFDHTFFYHPHTLTPSHPHAAAGVDPAHDAVAERPLAGEEPAGGSGEAGGVPSVQHVHQTTQD